MSQAVRDFFSYVDTYLKGDLEKFKMVCMECERISKNGLHGTSGGGDKYDPTKIPDCFRMTIPMTNTLFSTIDIVGFLLGTKDIGYSGLIKENFKQFFKKDVPDEEMEVLVNIYRHGMIHGYFPLMGVYISYHSSQSQKGLFYLFEGEKLILNVNKLIDLVLEKFDKFKNGNGSLFQRMDIQYKKFLAPSESKENGYKHMQTLIDKLKTKKN